MTSHVTSTGSLDETQRKRFELARREGRMEPIEHFLPGEEQPDYLATLEELVHIELEFAWKAWQCPADAANVTVRRPPLVSWRRSRDLRRGEDIEGSGGY